MYRTEPPLFCTIRVVPLPLVVDSVFKKLRNGLYNPLTVLSCHYIILSNWHIPWPVPLVSTIFKANYMVRGDGASSV